MKRLRAAGTVSHSARAIAASGHLIGNHTTTHPWLAWQSAARIREELSACNKALEDALGAPVHFFRAPHGARRPYVLRAARELGLIPVHWNIIAGDWVPIDPAVIVSRRRVLSSIAGRVRTEFR